jgi:hypothetical protein
MNGGDPDPVLPEVLESLHRIEAHIAEMRATVEAMDRRPARRDLGRALRRLVLAFWAIGLLAITMASWIGNLEALRNPRANVCATEEAEDYDECLRQPEAGSESLLETVRRLMAGTSVDRERFVRRAQTERYTISLRRLASVVAAWTVAAASVFAVLAWVTGGLRWRARGSREVD